MMRRSTLPALVAATAALVALSGCADNTSTEATSGALPTPSTVPSATSSANTGLGSIKDAGDIPDPCTLLTTGDVVDLTGREVSRMDKDGQQDGESTRYCQWQQPSGQLDVFLSRTTGADFQTTIAGAQPVDGVGEDAFSLSGHLYVLYGTVQIDVYSRGDSDATNLDAETKIAKVLIPKI
jgi:hypothetical protein